MTRRQLPQLAQLLIAGVAALCLTAAAARSDPRPQLLLQSGHTGHIAALDFAPDGLTLASCAGDSTVKLWDLQSNQELRTLPGHTEHVSSLQFGASGKWLVSGSWDHTVRVWDAHKAQLARVLSGPAEPVSQVAVSPDDKRVAAASWDGTLHIWDLASGKPIVRLPGAQRMTRALAFSPDSALLAVAGGPGKVLLVDARTGKQLRVLVAEPANEAGDIVSLRFGDQGGQLWALTRGGPVRWATETGTPLPIPDQLSGIHGPWSGGVPFFSRDAHWLLVPGDKGGIQVWDTASGAKGKVLVGLADDTVAGAVSADGRLVAAATRADIEVWDRAAGSTTSRLVKHTETVLSAAISASGRFVAGAHYDDQVRLWDAAQGREIKHFAGGGKLAFSPDERWLALMGGRQARFFDPTTAKQLTTLPGGLKTTEVRFVNPDGRWLMAERGGGWVLWDSARAVAGTPLPLGKLAGARPLLVSPSGEQVLIERDGIDVVVHLKSGGELALPDACTRCGALSAFAPNDSGVALPVDAKRVGLFELSAGKLLWRTEGHTGGLGGLAWSAGGKLLATVAYDKSARLWDAITGAQVAVFKGHLGWVGSVAFGPEDKILLTAGGDGTTRLWDIAARSERCKLVALDEADWAVVDYLGRFDASAGGMRLMHWLVGDEFIALDQLKQRYFEPGLLGKLLGFGSEGLRDVGAFAEVKLFPKVELLGPIDAAGNLHVRITDRGGGIGRIQVFLNGKELASDARGPGFTVVRGQGQLAVKLGGLPAVAGQLNPVRVVAWNAEGYLSSRGALSMWSPPAREATPPSLYAIVVGTSEYAAADLRLSFAAKDAEDFAGALRLAGNRLFGPERTHVTLLTTSAADARQLPSKARIAEAFVAARAAKPEDVLVIYMAGHGVAVRDLYAYPTSQARTLDLADSGLRAQVAITSDEVVDWIRAIPAVHQAMILDTCAAGAAAKRIVEKRDVPSDQIRAIETLKDRTGFFVLMGAAANAVSYEASEYGQGLLTYALLQGLRGAALDDGGAVDVGRLFGYAADRVPELARNIGGIQQPMVAVPGGSSFPIGQLAVEDRAAIPLAAARPLLLGPVLTNRAEDWDSLDLASLLRRSLRQQAQTRGPSGPQLVYVDAAEMAGAVRPQGAYSVEGPQVDLKINLIRDKQNLGSVAVQGSTADLGELARRAASEIARVLQAK